MNDKMLDDMRMFLFSKNDEIEIDYEEMTINYNNDGDTYYRLNTYCNNQPKSIMICARNEEIHAYVEINIINDDLYETLEYILNNGEEIEKRLDKQFEEYVKKSS